MSSDSDQVTLATLSIGTLLKDVLSGFNSIRHVYNIVCAESAEDIIRKHLSDKCVIALSWNEVCKQIPQADKEYSAIAIKLKDEQRAKTMFFVDDAFTSTLEEWLVSKLPESESVLLLNFPQEAICIIQESPSARLVDSIYVHTISEKNNFNLLLNSSLIAKAYDGSIKNLKEIKKFIKAKTAVSLGDSYSIAKDIAVAGLDISMSNTGIACLLRDSALETVLVGSLSSKPGKGDFFRGKDTEAALQMLPMRDKSGNKYLVNILSCKSFCTEGGALDAVQGAYRIGRYSGMLMSVFDIEDITEISPSRLKLLVTGYGASSKEYVAKMACKHMDFPEEHIYKNDESDALALLYVKINESVLNTRYPLKAKRPKKKRPQK